MRFCVGALFALTVCFAVSQDYTERWRLTTPGVGQSIFWGRPVTDSTDSVLVVGTARAPFPIPDTQPIAMKVSADGNEIWQTRGPDGDFLSVGRASVDAAGNLYFLVVDSGAGIITVRSLNSADGSLRWERAFGGIPISTNNPRDGFDLAVKSVGNSTFIYFAFSAANNTIQLARLNPANGQSQFAAAINGSLNGRTSALEIDSSGNVIMLMQNVDAIVTKRSQSLGLVWNRILPGTLDMGHAIHRFTGEIAAMTSSTFSDSVTLEVLDPVNGTPRRSRTGLPRPSNGFAQSVIFGHPTGAWYFGGQDAFGARSLVILTPTLKTQSERTFEFDFPAADSTGMLHGQEFDDPILANWPRFSSLNPNVAADFIGSVGIDSKDRVILAANANGDAHLVQYEQKFLAGTDTFAEAFTNSFEIEAPGVLANDMLGGDGVVSLVTTTTRGSLTLRPDGSFTYIPNGTFAGSDQFQYRVTKNGISRTATSFIRRLTISAIEITNNPVFGSELGIAVKVTLSSGASNLFQNISLQTNPANVIPATPRTLTYRPGEVSQQTSFNTPVVSASTQVTFFATLAGQTKSSVLTILPGAFNSFALVNAAPLYEGLPSKIRLSLMTAGLTARTFDMSYRGTAVVTGPTQIVVPAGLLFTDFTVVVPDGTAEKDAQILYQRTPGTFNGAFLRVKARPKLTEAGPTESAIYADFQHRYRAKVDLPAGNTAIPITHSSNHPNVSVPTINVQPGQTEATAGFTPRAGAANQNVTVTSRLLSDTAATTFLVRPNLLETFAISPQTIGPFSSTTGRVTFNWVATGNGVPVKISTTTPDLVIVPDEVLMRAGQTVLTFPIGARGRGGNAKITVKVGLKTITKSLTITSP